MTNQIKQLFFQGFEKEEILNPPKRKKKKKQKLRIWKYPEEDFEKILIGYASETIKHNRPQLYFPLGEYIINKVPEIKDLAEKHIARYKKQKEKLLNTKRIKDKESKLQPSYQDCEYYCQGDPPFLISSDRPYSYEETMLRLKKRHQMKLEKFVSKKDRVL